MDRDRALQLAAKLLNMDATKGCTPEEAANAAERLSKIMAEHNLDMLTVQAEQQRSNVGQETQATAWSRLPGWAWYLVSNVASAFRCKPIIAYGAGDKAEVRIIGDATEAALCRYFLGYLIDQLPRAFDAFSRTSEGWALLMGRTRNRVRASFIAGASQAVGERLRKMHEEWMGKLDETQQQQARGLVVVRGAAIKAFIAEKYPSLRTGRSHSLPLNGAAIQAGYRHGQSMNLSQGIRGGAAGGNHLGHGA